MATYIFNHRGKRGLSIALIYYCVLNSAHFFFFFSPPGLSKQETSYHCCWYFTCGSLVETVLQHLIKSWFNIWFRLRFCDDPSLLQTIQQRNNSLSDYLDYADTVHFPGSTWCLPAQDNWAEAVEREPGLHSLIGVMFSWAWSCSSPRSGLSGAGPRGRKRRAKVPGMQGDDLFTLSSPSGSPHCDTWHPGDKVTPLLWHNRGSWPYYQERRFS